MQEFFGFAVMVIAISASGVMSPGPLFSANIIYGIREGKIAVSYTHLRAPET